MRKLLGLLLAVLLIPALTVSATETGVGMEYIQKLAQAHRYGGDYRQERIEENLRELEKISPMQASIWAGILELWYYVEEEMPLSMEVLPDGLPEDDSLCIVVMGFRLLADGSMQPELEKRLTAALASAEKYPNAWILCTGGSTARNSQITEAGAMKDWLVEQGVAPERIIAETRANSSLENARYAYATLQEHYPQVDTLALVTSEYHIPRITMIFYAVGLYETLPEAYTLGGHAVCFTGRTGNNERQQTMDNLLQIARESPVPEPPAETVPVTEAPTEPATQPVTEPEPTETALPTEPAPAEPASAEPSVQEAPSMPVWIPVTMGALLTGAMLLLLLLIRLCRRR